MKRFPKPVVLVSKCLEFGKVRYNAQVMPSKIVRDLEPFVEYIKVCPEVEIGLGVPRDTIRIVKINGEKRLVQPKTGRDVTEEMREFTTAFLEGLPEVDGFIFKSRSPTIGIREIKVYSGIKDAAVIEKGSGLFAEQIMEKYSGYPMEEEDRLTNRKIRNHFLIHLFTFAAFREIKQGRQIEELVEFDHMNRYLFMSYHHENRSHSDDFLSNRQERIIDEIFMDYGEFLKSIFSNPHTSDSIIRTVKEIISRISDRIPEDQIDFLKEVINKYEKNLIGYEGLIEILRSYVMRFDESGIIDDALFNPYPEELQEVVDADRNRDFWKN
ncbi:MAG: DUF1722 domain-containing protein [Methanosarcinaceae archaeon]|nr:DUF1722 domain-containing protein [Methanosarcinaceae archaeon]